MSRKIKVNDALYNLISNDPDVSDAQPVLAAYLISHHASAQTAAVDLLGICLSQPDEDSSETTAAAIASFLWTAAVDVPALASRIAAVAAEINTVSQQTPGSGDAVAPARREAAARGFWKHFHETAGEYLQSKYYDVRQPSDGEDGALAEYFCLHAFAACFVTHSNRLNTKAETAYYDLGDAWMALSGLEDRFDDQGCADASADADVPASAAWILEAGPTIYDACKRGKADAGNDVRGPLWKGQRDFNIERWQFWKSRFEVVAGLDFVNARTKTGARSALAAMQALEQA